MLLFLPCNSSKYYCTKTHASKAKEPGTNDFLLPTKWYYGSICSGSSNWLNHLESQPLKITSVNLISIYKIMVNIPGKLETLKACTKQFNITSMYHIVHYLKFKNINEKINYMYIMYLSYISRCKGLTWHIMYMNST